VTATSELPSGEGNVPVLTTFGDGLPSATSTKSPVISQLQDKLAAPTLSENVPELGPFFESPP
jgi:hypothetical protein